MVSKTELRGAAKEIAKVFVSLDRTRKLAAGRGYVLNRFGSYWSEQLVDSWLTLNRRLGEADEPSTRLAASYSRGAFLLCLNRLREAQQVYEAIAESHPSAACLKGLAVVKARQGLLDEARELARRCNEAEGSDVYRTTEDELLEEHAIGQRFEQS
jgi:hypothetical protein